MSAQQNLLRSLKLIRHLKQRPGKTLDQLAQLLGCAPRHVRRLMETLEEAGFMIDKEGKRPPRFYLFEDERRHQLEFTEEEAELLRIVSLSCNAFKKQQERLCNFFAVSLELRKAFTHLCIIKSVFSITSFTII